MKVQICAPDAWRGEVVRARRRDGRGDLGEAILRLCHSSGLGVPVGTAFGFAGWISGRSGAAGAWDGLFPVPLLRHEGWSITNVVSRLALLPFDASRLLLFPVAARVQSELGEAQIFAELPGGGPLDTRLVARFEARLDEVLQGGTQSNARAAASDRAELKAWRHAIAIRCLQFLRATETSEAPQTDPDPVAAEMFLGAAALLNRDRSRQSAEPRPIRARTRVSHRFQSDGIEGIRHASPSEDPSTMLPSQMVYPSAIMAERMANEGFMAYDRPPHLPDRQRHVICVLAHVTREMRALSVARAAFWTAARSVEADLCRDLGRLVFAWLPIGREARRASRVVHDPPLGARMAHDQAALTWAQRFDAMGAPFLAGPRPPALAEVRPSAWPEDMTQPLWDAGLPIEADRTEPLRLHLSVVTDMPAEDAKVRRQALELGVAALQPVARGTAWLQLGRAPDVIAPDIAEPFEIATDFVAACQNMHDLADAWQSSMRGVLSHG